MYRTDKSSQTNYFNTACTGSIEAGKSTIFNYLRSAYPEFKSKFRIQGNGRESNMKIGLCEDQPINSSDKSEKSSFFDLFHHTNVKTDSGRQGIAYSSGDCYSEDDSLSIQSRGSERKPNENPSTRMESSYQAIVNEWKDKLRWNGLDEQSYL